MPTAKRASMREGPLAALFRKTAQDVDDEAAGGRAPGVLHRARVGRRARRRPTTTEASAPAERTAAPGPPVEPTVPARPPEPEFEEPRIPLPHERLRHAFSADIPENVLDASRSRRGAPERPPA